MTQIAFAPKARDDLAGIWQYTASAWSIGQADSYVRSIYDGIERLREFPLMGAEHRSLVGNFRKLRSGRHLVFYLVVEENVEIIRILHERADVDDALGG